MLYFTLGFIACLLLSGGLSAALYGYEALKGPPKLTDYRVRNPIDQRLDTVERVEHTDDGPVLVTSTPNPDSL